MPYHMIPSFISHSTHEKPLAARGWMFDLDGVLINLRAKRVTEGFLLEVLAACLAKGEPVTFNTGRSPEQVDQQILRPLAEVIQDETWLQRIMLVGEKGGAWANYTLDGALKVSYDARFSVPLLFLETVSDIVQSSDFAALVELEEKKTMVTLSMREGVSLEAFQQIQGHIARVLQQCLIGHGLASTWKVEVNGNAVEVEHRQAGKGLGARRIMAWLHAQRLAPLHMLAFGDSLSDLVMAEELSTCFSVAFIFVGASDLAVDTYPFPIIRTQSRYERGTIEYLSHVVPSVFPRKEA